MTDTVWILEKTGHQKFPYRVTIQKGPRILLRLLVQDRWPGQRGNIFCLRVEEDDTEELEEVERVPVVSIKRYGKRLSVVLDRATNKRCNFLFIKKQYKTKDGEYEQIFWQTEKGLKQHKPKVKLSTYRRTTPLHIAIAHDERYPWSFGSNKTERKWLPVGDYALLFNEGILAVIERKTFDNMLAEFGRMSIFHNKLSELEAYKYSALVIEANYSDFLNPDKTKYYSPSFSQKAIAEIHAFHPSLTVVFAGNRKMAMQWALSFFHAILSHEEDVMPDKVSEIVEYYGEYRSATGGSYYSVRNKIINDLKEGFTFSFLRELYPNVPESTLRRVINDLKKEGLIVCNGRGKNAFWTFTK